MESLRAKGFSYRDSPIRARVLSGEGNIPSRPAADLVIAPLQVTVLEGTFPFKRDSEEDRQFIVNTLLKGASLSKQTQRLDLAKDWSSRNIQERSVGTRMLPPSRPWRAVGRSIAQDLPAPQ